MADGIIKDIHRLSFCGPGSGLAVSEALGPRKRKSKCGYQLQSSHRSGHTSRHTWVLVGDLQFCEAIPSLASLLSGPLLNEEGVVDLYGSWLQ